MRFVPLMLIGVLASGCNLSPFTLGGGGSGDDDGGMGDDIDAMGTGDDGGGPIDGSPDACVPEPAGEGASPQACDNEDNDCDGVVDNGFNKLIDPFNCGTCGTRCIQPNTSGTCVSGGCSYECLPGFVDTDGDLSNGCEYLCTPTDGGAGLGVEACDFADNDCDEDIDEDLGLETDVNNCGGCGNVCVALHASPTCDDSTCGFGACDTGFEDVSTAIPGCEYQCPVTPTSESCDGVDQDCDGNVDNSCVNGSGRPCSPGSAGCTCTPIQGLGNSCVDSGFGTMHCSTSNAVCETTSDCPSGETCSVCTGGACDVGRCNFGAMACSFGVEVCSGYVRPTTETCDASAIDEDCDGVSDATEFSFTTNPLHCGGCLSCAQKIDAITPGASATVQAFGCSAGGCSITTCRAGHYDLDLNVDNGCEYDCDPLGPETCDGIDNDCDGLIDLGADGLPGGSGANADDPNLTGAVPTPASFCDTQGECSDVVVRCGVEPCGGPTKFFCDYSNDVEQDSCGDIKLQEGLCDGLDGNCDGFTDESYVDKGNACDDDDGDPNTVIGTGACLRDGTFVCNAAHTGLDCQFDADPDPGHCSVTTSTDCVTAADCPSPQTCVLPTETCENTDEDCDGTIDEDAPDTMVAVTGGTSTVYVYKYEASKPDATSTTFGNATHRSCSKQGVMPWRNVTFTEASAACAASGKRLCTEAEWQRACQGTGSQQYPYGNTYDDDACNGRDVDLDCTNPDSDEVAFTGRAFGDLNGGLAGCGGPSTATQCISPIGTTQGIGAVDMSGNLREWTSTTVDSARRVKGGAFDNIAEGLTCDFSFLAFATDVALPNLGFRCCSDTP